MIPPLPWRFNPSIVVAIVALAGMTVPATSSAKEPAVEIVAHRGASYDAPENTLSSIKLGWEQQADGVEFDIWLSKDGEMVLLHDKDTKRVAGVDRLVKDQTWAELQTLDVGRWKDAKYAGERMPRLKDALATIPSGKRVFVEVKCGPEVVPPMAAAIKATGRPTAEIAVICFQDDVVAAAKKALPDYKVYWLVSLKQDKQTKAWNHTVGELIARGKELHADGLDLQACDLIDADFGRQVRQAGLELLVWTVNDPAVARRMIAAGVQGITTDRPAWLREQLAGKASPIP
ncbi:MAG TPA: glycerophosphodiester phosphodiesterase [Planctomycetaceae bacterium]|nr:glycerophosphodiester phosphodiesterase [Planctomycetaceae bacterium]